MLENQWKVCFPWKMPVVFQNVQNLTRNCSPSPKNYGMFVHFKIITLFTLPLSMRARVIFLRHQNSDKVWKFPQSFFFFFTLIPNSLRTVHCVYLSKWNCMLCKAQKYWCLLQRTFSSLLISTFPHDFILLTTVISRFQEDILIKLYQYWLYGGPLRL